MSRHRQRAASHIGIGRESVDFDKLIPGAQRRFFPNVNHLPREMSVSMSLDTPEHDASRGPEAAVVPPGFVMLDADEFDRLTEVDQQAKRGELEALRQRVD